MNAFFTLHRDLPREAPGEAADGHWALAQVPVPVPGRVADLACGPGADLVTLAGVLARARRHGIDRQPHFVTAAPKRVAAYGARVTVRQGDMPDPGGPCDLIWCAGAIDMPGTRVGLESWRSALAPGGHIAFSAPVLVRDPDTVTGEFRAGVQDLADAAGIAAQVAAAGYRTLATRLIIGTPWANHYTPMVARIALLRPGAGLDLTQVLDEADRGIALWRANPAAIAYLLSVADPA